MTGLSLRARLTAWYVVVVVIVLGSFAAGVLVIQGRIGLRRIDYELDAIHGQLTNMMREELRELDAPRLAAEESRNVIASPGRGLAILDAGGAVLASSFEPAILEEIRPAWTATGIRTVGTSRGDWRVDVRRETLETLPLVIVVARPLSDLARDQQQVRQAIFLGIPAALVLAAAGGLWLASIGLGPITVMARRAASLPLGGEDDLGPPVREDELGQLTRAFNALVARLRSALQTQRQFMADASHELRNPVSVIRTASEVALSREHREEAEYREALAMAAAQSRHLGALVDDMLLMARADAGAYPLRQAEFFLDDLVEECSHALSVLAAERGVTLTSTGASDVAVRGDRELLRRLLVNLQQNGVQHTPPGGTVSVEVSPSPVAPGSSNPGDPGEIRIRVVDTGKGIAEADLARVFDRFVQIDPSRRSEGAGLGLTIARWIAEAHGGSLIVESSGPAGTTFAVALPIGLASAPADGSARSPGLAAVTNPT
jgi:signal transduction histidine kinase